MVEEKEEMKHQEDFVEEDDQIEDWEDWERDEEDSDSDFLVCLFCDLKLKSLDSMLEHCVSLHSFDFSNIRKTLGLDFYGSLKLINYVRSQVAENRCWSCGITCQSNKDLQSHLHEVISLKDAKLLWEDEKYLKPVMQDDSFLHRFGEDEDEDCHEDNTSVYQEELKREFMISEGLEKICLDDENILNIVSCASNENGRDGESSSSNGSLNTSSSLENVRINGREEIKTLESHYEKQKDKILKVSFAGVVAKEIKSVDESYFGAYSSFGIHREMISDKVRMDAYRGAILNNPSLMNHAAVMDVGCGTGILSLFAAKAGASRVIAVEASEKMASVATEIAKNNGQLWDENSNGGNNQCTGGVISVVRSMVEELDKHIHIPSHSIDVLLSEWMGYCLLYESMLSSVLYARDRWLKPGGAILPDTATIFVAGFGRGGTSIPFWENVYGFNMSCIGKEVTEDAARLPIVDVVDGHDLVTDAVVLQKFDMLTMKPDDMDFTASFELKLKLDHPANNTKSAITWCYGVVVWFETGFTSRFCKEMATVLSTSPYTPKTHWSQTILTFREPIAMTLEKSNAGSDGCPATRIQSRISIVRAAQHRSIDISLETAGVSADGQKRIWPVQIFNL